jgi:hypothetical protein
VSPVLVTGGIPPIGYLGHIVDGGNRQPLVRIDDLSFVDVCEKAGRKSGLFVAVGRAGGGGDGKLIAWFRHAKIPAYFSCRKSGDFSVAGNGFSFPVVGFQKTE